MSLYIFWDPSRALFPWNIPILDRPILWYGFFFALGFFLAYLVFQGLLRQFLSSYRVRRAEQGKLAERIGFHVIIGMLIGSRLGDVLLYQSPEEYVHSPLKIFAFWEGGLSSHGGVIGILLALWVLAVKLKGKYGMLNWRALLDLVVIPALLAGGFIRLGNFFNQEILGKVTSVPWAVVFGHPFDGSPPLPRHPVQLYESLFYFAFFFVLWALRLKKKSIYLLGRTSGLFFIVTFTFRFFVEGLKAPQSALLPPDPVLNMGQILSLPLIALGLLLFFRNKQGRRTRTVKGN